MPDMSRERRLIEAFVRLSDALVDGSRAADVLEVLIVESAEMVEMDAGGAILIDQESQPQVAGATTTEVGLLEFIQVNYGSGPGVESAANGVSVGVADIESAQERWPDFAPAAAGRGFESVYAVPLTHRGTTIGAIDLYSRDRRQLRDPDLSAVSALADIATIGIMNERVTRDAHALVTEMHGALELRAITELAKGVLAEIHTVGPDQAFAAIGSYAIRHDLSMRSVAESIVSRTIDVTAFPVS